MSKATQRAVQLVGPDQLKYNAAKPVYEPGPHQILCRVEAVGLCFSDLKLLKQFTRHVRKGEVVAGVEPQVLSEIPSYVPGEAPTVPGHEMVVRVEKAGEGVEEYKAGRRYLVQPDFRWIKTATSNGALGYNFEGALQEFILLDERVFTDPDGESMLLGVSDELSASAAALAEPWACVEQAYASTERSKIKAGGDMLIVCDIEINASLVKSFLERFGQPGRIVCIGKSCDNKGMQTCIEKAGNIDTVKDSSFDDILYFGSNAEMLAKLFVKLGGNGLGNIICCSGKFGKNVTVPVGRVHYGGIRIVGTAGNDPAESMAMIPQILEIRAGDKINIVGAAGPMGMMHVIRNICRGVQNVSIYAGDVDDNRLATLRNIIEPLAQKNNVTLKVYNAVKDNIDIAFDYTAIMASIPKLVTDAVAQSAAGGIINIFAGIPAAVTGEINMDAYITKGLYLAATSGSTLDDIKTVLASVESGRLDTNTSVAAICGLESAIEAIRAVESRAIAGKIMVYPACKDLPLTRLEEISQDMSQVADCLDNGLWTKEAEDMLLKIYSN